VPNDEPLRARARSRRAGALVCALLFGPAAQVARAADLSVAAASSLREPFTEIARLHEREHPGLRVRLAFAASSVLAAQVRAGAPIDVFVSADARIADALEREGLIDSRCAVAGNRLVVVTARDAALEIQRPHDLVAPNVRRIAIPEHAVPVGRYAREWLASHGLLEQVAARTVRTEHARATLIAVDLGLVDVAIVYASDVRRARSARVAFEIPREEQPRIAYVAATLADAAQREPARAFLRFLRGPSSAEVLARAGFEPAPRDAEDAAP
jgi:molybdate transport system substrate-binding protein